MIYHNVTRSAHQLLWWPLQKNEGMQFVCTITLLSLRSVNYCSTSITRQLRLAANISLFRRSYG